MSASAVLVIHDLGAFRAPTIEIKLSHGLRCHIAVGAVAGVGEFVVRRPDKGELPVMPMPTKPLDLIEWQIFVLQEVKGVILEVYE